LHDYKPALYKQLEDYPADVIPIFDLVALSVYKDMHMGYSNNMGVDSNVENIENEQIIQVRPFNMQKSLHIRDLDPKFIDKLISLKGIVIRTSDTIPEMKEACYRCSKCGNQDQKFVERGKIIEPEFCENCRGQLTFEIVHNYCMFSDKQHVKI